MLRRLLVLALWCSCGAPVYERADAAADVDTAVDIVTTTDVKAEAINASTATGQRQCGGGSTLVYSQPQRTTLVPPNGAAPAFYTVVLTADAAEGYLVWVAETMGCTSVALFADPACGKSPEGRPLFCNHGARVACSIYRKPVGQPAWHLSRSGSVDFGQASYEPVAGQYTFLFSAETWGTEGPSGCPGDATQLNSYEFH